MSTTKQILLNEDFYDGYYHFTKDIEDYPDCWLYIVYSGRKYGKTYGGLRYFLARDLPIVYVKRTKKDVNFISKTSRYGLDRTPYAPLNRDFGTDIDGINVEDGVGVYGRVQDGDIVGDPCAFVFSLNGVKDIKGFELSKAEAVVMDEFIPQLGEVVKRDEGEMLLSLYMTINRDREARGRKPLKLVLFSNCDDVSTPITRELGVLDNIVEMEASGRSTLYIKSRGIFIRHCTPEEFPKAKENTENGIFKGMRGTKWLRKNLEGDFASNDFSNIMKMSIKKMKCFMRIDYQGAPIFIYRNEETGMHYACTSRGSYAYHYDLDKENDQKLFWVEHGIDLRLACIEGRMKFEKYSYYDLIVNYKQLFRL